MADNELVRFNGADKLPAHLRAAMKGEPENPFANAIGTGGFPMLSIKGKSFAVVRGDEREIIYQADGESPASRIPIIILAVNPNRSKIYYKTGYVEGSTDKPDCYSNDGIAPARDAEKPQCKTCAACPWNEWGSRISESGQKVKACTDSMRLAVASPDQINDPVLLRVPAASLKALGQYGNQLAKRHMQPEMVVTSLSFDFTVSHPQLTFKAVGFVDADQFAEVQATLEKEHETIQNILGLSGVGPGKVETKDASEDEDEPKPKPKRRVAPEPEDEDEPKRRASPKKAETEKKYDSLDEAFEDLDFDD